MVDFITPGTVFCGPIVSYEESETIDPLPKKSIRKASKKRKTTRKSK